MKLGRNAMYYNNALSKLLISVVLLSLAPSHLCQDVSKEWAVSPGEYPFLVLVHFRSYSGGPAQFVNGVLASLSSVLTLSDVLVQLPSGRPSPSLQLQVHAGLTDLSLRNTSPYRLVIKITNELLGKDNKYFPNLVLLKLETPFRGSTMIQPVVLNVGMLSLRSMVVGWAHLPGSNITLSHAVGVQVVPKTSSRCSNWELVEFPEQMCCYDLEPHPLRLGEGALLVDQKYLTAIKQFDTYLQSHLSTPIALFVRIHYFVTWIQSVVLDPVPTKVFLKTNFDNDDITQDPDENSMGSILNHSSLCPLLTSVVLAMFV